MFSPRKCSIAWSCIHSSESWLGCPECLNRSSGQSQPPEKPKRGRREEEYKQRRSGRRKKKRASRDRCELLIIPPSRARWAKETEINIYRSIIIGAVLPFFFPPLPLPRLLCSTCACSLLVSVPVQCRRVAGVCRRAVVWSRSGRVSGHARGPLLQE